MFDYTAAAGVTDLAAVRPGPDGVAALAAVDLDVLTADSQLDALTAIERQIGWLQGMQQRVLAGIEARLEATAPRARPPVANAAREEVGCALRLAPQTAADRLAIAGTLCDRLPATLHALEAGEISYWHARALAEAAIRVDPLTAARLEQAVLPEAGEQSVGRFRTAVAKALLAIDPAPAEQRHDRALGDRCVRHTPADDGMATLWALLPAEGAAALMQVVDALASVTSADDPRTVDQRRADALVDLGVAALHDPALPRAQGLRPHVQVTISLSTLLGLDEHPGQLAGHGPIPAELVRRIAADPTGSWRRLILDPHTGGCWTTVGAATGHPPTWPGSSSPATSTAPSRSASATPPAAIWTTRSATPTAASPAPTTSPHSARATTPSRTTAAGRSPANPTATTTGPAPPAAATPCPHPATPTPPPIPVPRAFHESAPSAANDADEPAPF